MAATRTWVASPGAEVAPELLEEFTRVCVKNSEYDYVSGGHGHDFVDLDELFGPNDGEEAKLSGLIESLARRIKDLRDAEGYNLLAFVVTRPGPVGIVAARVLLAQKTGMRSMVIRPEKRLLSQAAKPFVLPKDAHVLIVSDVATTGRSIWHAAEVLWKLGARNCGALAFADRGEGAEHLLSSMDIPLYSIVKVPDSEAA